MDGMGWLAEFCMNGRVALVTQGIPARATLKDNSAIRDLVCKCVGTMPFNIFPGHAKSVVVPRPYPQGERGIMRRSVSFDDSGPVEELGRRAGRDYSVTQRAVEIGVNAPEHLICFLKAFWWDEFVFVRIGPRGEWTAAAEDVVRRDWRKDTSQRRFVRRADRDCVARFDFCVMWPWWFACHIDVSLLGRDATVACVAAFERAQRRFWSADAWEAAAPRDTRPIVQP